MNIQTITRTLAVVALLAAPACDSGTKPDPKTAAKPETKPAVKTEAKIAAKPDTKAIDKPVEEKPVEAKPPEDPNAAKIQLAATVAKEISGAPDKADEILGKHGLDRDKLDALMFEIAGDPALTQAYMDARRAS
jgi:hypothetical protein